MFAVCVGGGECDGTFALLSAVSPSYLASRAEKHNNMKPGVKNIIINSALCKHRGFGVRVSIGNCYNNKIIFRPWSSLLLVRIEFSRKLRLRSAPCFKDKVFELISSGASFVCTSGGRCLLALYVKANRCRKALWIVTVDDDVDSINLMNGYHDVKSVFTAESVFASQRTLPSTKASSLSSSAARNKNAKLFQD